MANDLTESAFARRWIGAWRAAARLASIGLDHRSDQIGRCPRRQAILA
jgi:hypothetical protein